MRKYQISLKARKYYVYGLFYFHKQLKSPDEELDAYTVRRLRGKEYIGNVSAVSEPFEYAELKI